MKKEIVVLFLASLFFLSGCGTNKSTVPSALSETVIYKNIADAIIKEDLDKADELYLSLKSRYANSLLLEDATRMLLIAHMQKQEYLLANFYATELQKRFENDQNSDEFAFLKLKAHFMGIKETNKDQKLITQTVAMADTFKQHHSDSAFVPLADTLYLKLLMTRFLLNENIAALYDRIGKTKAAAIYREKNSAIGLSKEEINRPDAGFLSHLLQ